MKKLILPFAILFAAGCSAQVHQTPPPMSCPAAVINGTAYTSLNTSFSGVTAGTNPGNYAYTDNQPVQGYYCYIAQSYDGAQYSNPSNVAGPYSVLTSQSVYLQWSDSQANLQYVVSRAPAIPQPGPQAPVMGAGKVAMMVKPALPLEKSPAVLAKNEGLILKAIVK